MAGIGGSLSVSTNALDALARKLIADAPRNVQKALTGAVRQAGQLIADDAAQRTYPGVAASIKVSTNRGTATITASQMKGNFPLAARIEGNGSGGNWRHPLFGDRSKWYDEFKSLRPYLHPALQAKKQQAQQLMVDACAEAVQQGLLGGD